MKTLDLCAIVNNSWASDGRQFGVYHVYHCVLRPLDGQIPPVDRVIFGTKIDIENHRSGGPPWEKAYIVNPDIRRTAVWPATARRELLFRPYIHARISRIKAVRTAKLPQIISYYT